MELQHFSHDHMLVFNVKNILDPDERISCLCLICNLPIFSTPYYSCSSGCRNLFIHQQCTRLPRRIKHVSMGYFDAEVVPGSRYSCNKCYRKYGNVRWGTELHPANFLLGKNYFLDALCIVPLEIRIFHESHKHELIPTMHEGDFTVCHACGLRHEKWPPRRLSLFYWCWWCRFWIHENCATSPNYIQHDKHHDHPLALTYALPRGDRYIYHCGICSSTITSSGVYFCWTCSYYAHIKCATRGSELYELVPSRDQSGYWIQFPMENEDTSMVAHILENMKLENITNTSSSSSASDKHEHPLIFNATSANPGRPLMCDGCVQPISSPYYSCSQCTNFLLHESCANLPRSIVHWAHEQHPLVLVTKYDRFDFFCNGCWSFCNGFSYLCGSCDFRLDVQCAFLPKSIMHKAHDKRHVLHLSHEITYLSTNCCNERWFGPDFKYICTSCDFQIHSLCAERPMSVTHKYDKHPLKLIPGRATITDHNWDNYSEVRPNSNIIAATSSSVQQQQSYSDEINLCEFCEKKIDSKYWYYDCAECSNSFHVDCIPAVGKKSKIKLLASLNIPCHPHPLTGIRLLTTVSRNNRCGYCGDKMKNFEDVLAFECDFTIRGNR